jgi:hypothetical protein
VVCTLSRRLVAVKFSTISDLGRRHKQDRLPWQALGFVPNGKYRSLRESTPLHLYLAGHSSGSLVHTASDPVGGAAFDRNLAVVDMQKDGRAWASRFIGREGTRPC